MKLAIIMGTSCLFFINILTTWGPPQLRMSVVYATLGVEIGIMLKGIHEHSECVPTYLMVSITLIAYVRRKM